MTFDQFINDFLSLNPHPTKEQAEWLAFSLGVSDMDKPDFIEHTLQASVKRRSKLCALTETERVLINDYDPALTETDNLLINDGDNLTDEPDLGNQRELSQDGVVDQESSIEAFLYHNERL